jgi:hypothetical protein
MITRRQSIIIAAASSLLSTAAMAQEDTLSFKGALGNASKLSTRNELRIRLNSVLFYIDAIAEVKIDSAHIERSRITINVALKYADRQEIPSMGADLTAVGSLADKYEEKTSDFYNLVNSVGISPGSIAARIIIEGNAVAFIILNANKGEKSLESIFCVFPFCPT